MEGVSQLWHCRNNIWESSFREMWKYVICGKSFFLKLNEIVYKRHVNCLQETCKLFTRDM